MGCGGVALDTRVAENLNTRLAMMQSVRVGTTTETAFVTRWGNPYQKVREGGQVEYLYRAMVFDGEYHVGDSSRYVIVTFRHGLAIGVRSSDTEGCRGTFAPRLPGYGFDTPATVTAVGWCQDDPSALGPNRPEVPSDDYAPNGGALK